MLKKLKKSKRGQTGETITWLVATIIIIVVLTIAIFFTKLVINPDKVAISLEDKQKNFIATKSITSFLKNPQTIELIQNKEYSQLETEIKKLLETLPKPPLYGVGGWNFQLYDNNKKNIEVIDYQVVTNGGQYNSFEDNIFLGQDRLRFWFVCQGICK